MMNKRNPPAPSHLTAATKRWWKSVLANYALQDHHLHLLRLACDALDRAEQARGALATHGTIYTDRFGAPHPRPEVAIERDSRISFARLCRELDLDTEMAEASRPPPLRSNRR
jgi:P27 family predicted phage terminase small subunit